MSTVPPTPSKSIFITGASSGIGRQLALEFARRGYRLGLTARRGELLAQLRDELSRQSAAQVETATLDVTDYPAVARCVRDMAASLSGLDIVVANAGIGNGEKVGRGEFAKTQKTLETNVLGAIATLDTAVELFRAQGRGQVVGISSVAGFRGMPGAASYCASKSALTTYLEALRAELHGQPIQVTALYPGYIDTPINRDMGSRPFVIDVEKGGRLLAGLIEKRVGRASVPRLPWALVRRLLPLLPTAVVAKFA